jgi:DNA-binding phage protein
MATTTQITNIASKFDLNSYAGQFAGDFDMEAVHADYVTRLNEALPRGITLARNGDVYADVDVADEARDIDWDEFIGDYDPADLFERHDRTAELLSAVTDAAQTAILAERQRVSAVRAAKNSGRFTAEEIAAAAGVTRDGVYKMLARSRPTVALRDAEMARYLAGMPQIDPAFGGPRVDVEGATVTLNTEALDLLADLDEDIDGHYDGTHIWIGGTEYRVEG